MCKKCKREVKGSEEGQKISFLSVKVSENSVFEVARKGQPEISFL
jgi:hypothetical protein